MHLSGLSFVLHDSLDALDSSGAALFHNVSLRIPRVRPRTKHVHLILLRNGRRLKHIQIFDLFGIDVHGSLFHVSGDVDLFFGISAR